MQSCSCKNLGVRQVAKKKKKNPPCHRSDGERRELLGPTDQTLDPPLIDIFIMSLFAGPTMEETFITITTFCYPEFKIISITYTRDIIELSFLSLQIMYVHSLVVIITVEKYT